MVRRPRDFYETPGWATRVLIDQIDPQGSKIVECCSGDGAIADVLRHEEVEVITNDLDILRPAKYHLDAACRDLWIDITPPYMVISNPPFKQAPAIVLNALRYSTAVAMLLRLSFLEPCDNRKWIANCPPDSMIVLPRISFTGDGKHDSVTCAWFLWCLHLSTPITIIGKPHQEQVDFQQDNRLGTGIRQR